MLSGEDEAKKIWMHIEVATALCIGMMEGYIQFGLLGANTEALTVLAGRLNTLAHNGESLD